MRWEIFTFWDLVWVILEIYATSILLTRADVFPSKYLGDITWVLRRLFHWSLGYFGQGLSTPATKEPSEPTLLVALCGGNPAVTSGFPAQRASNGESVSLSWHHGGLWVASSKGTGDNGSRQVNHAIALARHWAYGGADIDPFGPEQNGWHFAHIFKCIFYKRKCLF